jgi:hypothetical protein
VVVAGGHPVDDGLLGQRDGVLQAERAQQAAT